MKILLSFFIVNFDGDEVFAKWRTLGNLLKYSEKKYITL